jgi:hypothetical protein
MADEPNPRLSKPLGLPDGSVRAILALMITVGAFWLFYNGKLQSSGFIALVALPIGLYFGQYIAPPGGANVEKLIAPLQGMATHAINQLGQAAGGAAAVAGGAAIPAAANGAAVVSTLPDTLTNPAGHIDLDAATNATGEAVNAAEAVAYGNA